MKNLNINAQMKNFPSKDDILLVKSSVTVKDVVEKYGKIQLNPKGSRHEGLCPFHNEKTPSFTVYNSTDTYYCFGCRKHGDQIELHAETNPIVRHRRHPAFVSAVLDRIVRLARPQERWQGDRDDGKTDRRN